MAAPSHGSKPLRVLLSEGSSTSAREAITVLGLAGHIVEVCDPSPVCLGRLSRFVRKFHRCPGIRDDPAGYLSFAAAGFAGKNTRARAGRPRGCTNASRDAGTLSKKGWRAHLLGIESIRLIESENFSRVDA